MKSSSIHSLNADTKLGPRRKKLYKALNYANNLLLPSLILDPGLRHERYRQVVSKRHAPRLPITASPSRYLSNVFWANLPWAAMRQELGSIRMTDIGCGKGGYYAKFQQWGGNVIDAYHGCDARQFPQWEELSGADPRAAFHATGGIDDLVAVVRDTDSNCIVSQSALEHIEGDMELFAKLAGVVRGRTEPVLHIHLVPSHYDFMKIYKLHGVRQYSPRSISMLTRKLADFSYTTLYGLGGKRCNAVHHEFISRPIDKFRVDLREHVPALYSEKLLDAVIRDSQDDEAGIPCFFAWVTHSHHRTPLFKTGQEGATREKTAT